MYILDFKIGIGVICLTFTLNTLNIFRNNFNAIKCLLTKRYFRLLMVLRVNKKCDNSFIFTRKIHFYILVCYNENIKYGEIWRIKWIVDCANSQFRLLHIWWIYWNYGNKCVAKAYWRIQFFSSALQNVCAGTCFKFHCSVTSRKNFCFLCMVFMIVFFEPHIFFLPILVIEFYKKKNTEQRKLDCINWNSAVWFLSYSI